MFLDILSAVLNILLSQTALLTATLAALLYYFVGIANHDYFAKRNVPFVKPLPFFGNIMKPALGREDFYSYYKGLWRKFGDVPFFGIFDFIVPVYVIKDPDLAKQILIKDFDHFVNHRVSIDHDVDPYFGRNLFAIKDQRWKDMRNILSPAFTGSKMRFLFGIINKCALQSVDFVLETTRQGQTEFEVKTLFTCITNDVIATAAFGIEVNSTKDPQNDFYRQARKFADFGLRETMLFFLYSTMPKFTRLTGQQIFTEKKTRFLVNIVEEAIAYREKTGFTRPDMIHLLLEAKAKGFIRDDEAEAEEPQKPRAKIEWSDEDIVAQCLLFFIAGFETASTLYVFLAYELALHPEVQAKLRAEVDAVAEKLGDKQPSYDDIINMKYMEMVVCEALRKWPPNIAIDRLVSKEYTMSAMGQTVTLQRGTSVMVPTIAFHHDPKYFPDPEKFDPERFSDENRPSIHQAVYTPFGIGPRQCIGNRLALMEVKIFYYHLISRFFIERNARTEVPPSVRKGALIVTPINGLYLTFKPRT